MKTTFTFLFFTFTGQYVSAIENTIDFHSANTLFAKATVSSHSERSNASRTFDPRIGIAYSFPFYYNFFHIDLSAEMSPRLFFAHDYTRTSTSHSSNPADTFIRTDHVLDQKGLVTVLSVYPTFYLKHFFIGFGDILDIEYFRHTERYVLIDPTDQDTLYKSKEQEASGLHFNNVIPGLKFGWRFSAVMLAVFIEPDQFGLSYHQRIAYWPSKKKNLRTSIFD